MDLAGISAVVTGGASGLGLATVERLQAAGAQVTIFDLRPRDGSDDIAVDVADEDSVSSGFEVAASRNGPVRAVVHCAGRGGDRVRILNRDGEPGPLDSFAEVIRVNLVGTYNVLRLAAKAMAPNEPIDGERGAIVMTASVAAFDGQIGQTAYSASKAAVHGMTLVAARDLASKLIRVNTIAPGVFDTPMLGRLPDNVRGALEASVPNPSRLGQPDDYGRMAVAMLENSYLNGETIRLDGAIRMPPR